MFYPVSVIVVQLLQSWIFLKYVWGVGGEEGVWEGILN